MLQKCSSFFEFFYFNREKTILKIRFQIYYFFGDNLFIIKEFSTILKFVNKAKKKKLKFKFLFLSLNYKDVIDPKSFQTSAAVYVLTDAAGTFNVELPKEMNSNTFASIVKGEAISTETLVNTEQL